MKQFIACVFLGYALVFFLFISLPKIMNSQETGRMRNQTIETNQKLQKTTTVEEKATPASRKTPVSIVETNKQSGADQKEAKPDQSQTIETYYRNGTLSSEWVAEDLDQRGLFRTYTSAGQPWMEIPFENKEVKGTLKVFYPEGPVFSEEEYGENGCPGKISWFYPYGNAWLEMKRDSVQGWLLESLYSENGKRADVPEIKTDASTGYFKAFDAEGHEVTYWQSEPGKTQTLLTTYYAEGKKSAELTLAERKLQGKMVRYFQEGALWMDATFSDQGEFEKNRVYDRLGNLSFEQTKTEAGTAFWTQTAYYPDGHVFWILTRESVSKRAADYYLTTYWQDETSAETHKVRVLS